MKKDRRRLIPLLIPFLIVVFCIGVMLLVQRKIWFVYPNRAVYGVEGLDVSHHQGEIEWDAVDANYRFVFIKASEGDTFIDKRVQRNIQAAKRTDRIVGAYHFFHFNYGGGEQADNFINTVGKKIDLPPVIDFEFSGNPLFFDKETVVRELKACIARLESYYRTRVILYTTASAYKEMIRGNFDNPLWYRSLLFPINPRVKNVLFWQYHNSARISGIAHKVDLNVFKGTLEDLQKLRMGYDE